MGKFKSCDKCGEKNPVVASVCELKPVKGFGDYCVYGIGPKPAAKVETKKKYDKKNKKKWVKK